MQILVFGSAFFSSETARKRWDNRYFALLDQRTNDIALLTLFRRLIG
jgi:hypothetical protein